ncbi:MAG TPA: RDD family protein [Pseudonocardiaceae bacterium]|nr:RDD family protein [Pseudonocardiaceae bacterium]
MTRSLAAAVDTAVVIAADTVVYWGLCGLLYVWSPRSFRWPQLPTAMIGIIGATTAVVYLTVCWATVGRGYGGSLFGLRVLSVDHRLLGWPHATLRAVCCVLVPIGLLWALISPRRRSLQDVVLRSMVVYDWNRDGPGDLSPATVAAHRPAGR